MSRERTNDETKEILLSYGYVQVGQYTGARNPIKCEDADGYIVYPVLYRLYEGKRPLRFHQSNPDSIANIKHYIEINNINVKLCSEKFIDAKSN